jgi:hypothetical protein
MKNPYDRFFMSNYPEMLLDQQCFFKTKLRNLRGIMQKTDQCNPIVADQIIKTIDELKQIDDEIDIITGLAFYPHHQVPIFDMITEEKYHIDNDNQSNQFIPS